MVGCFPHVKQNKDKYYKEKGCVYKSGQCAMIKAIKKDDEGSSSLRHSDKIRVKWSAKTWRSMAYQEQKLHIMVYIRLGNKN